jgi:hypothetical protein
LRVIMVGLFLASNGCVTSTSYLRSHQKRNTQVSISAGTKNVEKMSDTLVDSSLQKKMEKSANQQARIPHFGKAGTP